jgi:hypothetical protein
LSQELTRNKQLNVIDIALVTKTPWHYYCFCLPWKETL